MLVTTLQFSIRFVLILGVILGLAFMIACTALVIAAFNCGDIRIKDEAEKENK